MKGFRLTIMTAIIALLFIAGCSSKEKKQETLNPHAVATSRYAPQPVYNPIRTVLLPQVQPSRKQPLPKTEAPMIMPIIELEVKDSPLGEVVQILESTVRYRVYCSRLISKRKVTLHSLGTLDELAEEIATQTKTSYSLDHESKELSFKGNNYVAPHF